MKFGQAHRATITLLAALSALALAGSTPLSARPGVLAFVFVLLAAQGVAIGLTLDLARSRRRPGGSALDAPILVLALVHLVAATVLGGGAAFGPAFVAVVVLLPVSLVLSHLRREVEGNYHQGARDRSGMPVDVPRILRSRRVVGRGFFVAMLGAGAPLLALTALLFVAMPRLPVGAGIGLSRWLDGGDRVHFTDAVSLHGDGALSPDPSVALRFTIDGDPATLPRSLPMRFRGVTLDTFDGRTWRRSEGVVDAPTVSDARVGRAVRIERTSFEPASFFVPEGATHVSDLQRLGDTRMAYVAWLGPAAPSLGRAAVPSATELALPTGVAPRARALARTWTAGLASPDEKARAIARNLRASLAYDLASPSRAASDPVDDFVLVSKRGHCELFASSMAIMLREIGIPARLVSGLAGGTLNRFGGFYAVRHGDAHVWVEARIGDQWVTFDPTPSAAPATKAGVLAVAGDLADVIARHAAPIDVDYDAAARRALGAQPQARRLAGIALALFVAWLLARLPRGLASRALALARRPRANDRDEASHEATRLYEALERVLADQGLGRDAATPPLAHAEALARSGHPLGEEVLGITRAYLEARFGARPLARDEAAALRKRIAALAL
ncbi:MAG: DUF3488 domain-containing protein [Deltaproteobacteria bacterium]|nr:DUF3488 domain-containing protein [Deltaproteobacteria bacterium]